MTTPPKTFAIFWFSADNFCGIVLTDKDIDEEEVVKQWLDIKKENDRGRYFARVCEPIIL